MNPVWKEKKRHNKKQEWMMKRSVINKKLKPNK